MVIKSNWGQKQKLWNKSMAAKESCKLNYDKIFCVYDKIRKYYYRLRDLLVFSEGQ